MIGQFRDLRGFVPNLAGAFTKLAVTSSLASFAEACVLVVVVRVALGLTDDSLAPLQLPFTDTAVSNAALVAIAGVLALVNLLLHIVEAHFKASLISDVYRGARRASIRAFTSASWSRQSLEREGALQETVTSLTTQSANLMLTLVTMLTSTLHLAVLLVIAALVNPLATLVVIAFGTVLFGALRPIAHATERRATEWVRRNTTFAEQMTSTSAMAMELRIFGRDVEARSQLESLNDEVADTMRRMRVVSGLGGTMYRDVALLVIVGAIASVLNADQQSLLGFGVVALLVLRSVGSAQRVQSSLQSARETAPALASLRERIASLEASAEVVGTIGLPHIDHVTLESVGYSYEAGPPALSDVNLTIDRGEVLGVVGPSGSGKSTFAQLLLRLRRPTSGRIIIDGRDYIEYNADDWSRLVALVPQDARLLEGTIADNVRFLRDGYPDEAVMAAVAAAHLVEDLDRFPDGLQTRLGPRGGGLSGGQRQRLAIARALLGRPELLVLDEPTSALDGKSEQLLKVTISDLKAASTTMVIIAHRLTTLESCDRIAVVKDGRLDQLGTRDELTREPGFYRSVVSALSEP